MSSTSMISKVETVLSLQNNPKECKKQSMKNNRKLDEQVISDLKLKGQLSELNHQQSYSLIGQHSMGGRRQMETRINSFSSEESSYNSTDSGHSCYFSNYGARATVPTVAHPLTPLLHPLLK